MKEYEEKWCIICGKPFIPNRCTQVTCAEPECKKARQRLRQLQWHKANHRKALKANREYMQRKREQERYVPKPDTIVAIGYAERQMADSLAKAGKVKVEL